MKTELKKLFEGDLSTVTLLTAALQEASAIIAGYGALGGDQQVFVFQDQWEKATEVLKELNLNKE